MKWFRRLTVLCVVLIAVWLLSSYAVAYRLTHRLQPLHDEPAQAIDWGKIQELRFHTSDGEQVGAWFIAGNSGRPTVVLLHGNGGSRSSCLSQAEMLVTRGYSVLMLTLRGHGDSSGNRNDFGYSARLDLIAGIHWLEESRQGTSIVVWGQSLGSAAAIFAADELGDRIAGYILECPYQDLRTAVWDRLKMRLPAPLDAIAYEGLLTVSPLVLPNVDLISPKDAIAKIPKATPVLILAGGDDRWSPANEAETLANQIQDHCRLIVFPGASHLQLQATDPTAYLTAILAFLDRIGRS